VCLPKTSFCLEWLKLQSCGVPAGTALIVCYIGFFENGLRQIARAMAAR